MNLTALMNVEKFLTQLLQPNYRENIAIPLYSNKNNQAITQLCQTLTLIQTRPFTAEQTTQELITKIKAWLSEM
jgi:hypothetical protein